MSPHPREPLASRSSLSATYFGFVHVHYFGIS